MGAAIGMLKGVTHSEFAHVQFAKEHRTGVVQFSDHRGVFVRNEVFQNCRTTGGENSLGVDLILDGDRHSVHRATVIPADDFLFGLTSVIDGSFASDGDVGIEFAVNLGNTL